MRTGSLRQRTRLLSAALFIALALGSAALNAQMQGPQGAAQLDDPSPPAAPVKLIFIHHSTGEAWLADDHGQLGATLRDNNYFVSDTNYGWGPNDLDVGSEKIGDHTDIGHWYNWFAGPNRNIYLRASLKRCPVAVARTRSLGYTSWMKKPGGVDADGRATPEEVVPERSDRRTMAEGRTLPARTQTGG